MAYPDIVKSDKPVLYLRQQETSGTVLVDSSGNGLNGSLVNPPVLGRVGPLAIPNHKAIEYRTAGDEHATVAHNALLNFGDIFTVEIWFKRTIVSYAARRYFFSKATTTSSATNAVNIGFQPDNKIIMRKPFNTDMAVSTIPIDDTTNWHHVIAQKNGAMRRIVIDGIDRTSLLTNDTTNNISNDVYLIKEVNVTETLGIIVTELALYNYVLSQERYLRHYHGGLKNLDYVGSA